MIVGDLGTQTRRVMANISAILRSQNLDFSDLVKVTIYLTDMKSFEEINQAYGGYFSEDPPARACVEVSALPKDAKVEIEAVALFPEIKIV
jgi:2-iminobutanoate/2-iminopropanoate deaminase